MYWINLKLAFSFFVHALFGGKCIFTFPPRSEVESALRERRYARTVSATFVAVIHENPGPTEPAGGFTFEQERK